jgi:hypothetical protein
MLTEPIVVTVDAESRSYSRISTGPGKSSSYRAKNPAGVDDAHLNIKHQDASAGCQRHLIQATETVEATDTEPESPVKINITIEAREDASGRAKALFKGVVAKLEADTDAILDSVLWGES